MPFSAVTAEEVRQAQIITGVATAVFIGIGVVPGLRPYGGKIRLVLLAAYALIGGGFAVWLLLR